MTTLWQVARDLEQQGHPFVVVTMVQSRGHAPQDPGAKAIITDSGLHWGTIGGGKVEMRAIAHARELLAAGRKDPELRVWNLQTDIGMTCGGEVTYLFEIHRLDAWKIVVFGAGHVAQAVVRALEPLDCHVTCIDSRPEWVERLPRSAKLEALHLEDPSAYVERLRPDSYVVVMTQGHATDLPILDALMRKHPDLPFLGSIGSDVKGLRLRSDLSARGISAELTSRLRCPVGLPIGGNQPAEIAISVVAQLLQVRDEKKG